MVLDNPAYAIGSFEGFLTTDTDYVAWFLGSSVGPIIDDCLLNEGRGQFEITCRDLSGSSERS